MGGWGEAEAEVAAGGLGGERAAGGRTSARGRVGLQQQLQILLYYYSTTILPNFVLY